MFIKSPEIRKFTYRPIFYKPHKEEEEGPRIKFRRHRHSGHHPKRSLLGMVILVIILVFLLSYWLKIESSDQKEFKFKEIEIEEIR